MDLSEGTTEKIPSDTTGDRSRDRPTSSATPYPLRYPFKTNTKVEHSLPTDINLLWFLSSRKLAGCLRGFLYSLEECPGKGP
jgi:hypothetical protein